MTVIAVSQRGGEDERYVATPHLTSTDVEWTHTERQRWCACRVRPTERSFYVTTRGASPRVPLSTDTAAAAVGGRQALRTMSLASWVWNWVFTGDAQSDVSWYPATHNLRVSRCVLTEERAHYWMTADMAHSVTWSADNCDALVHFALTVRAQHARRISETRNSFHKLSLIRVTHSSGRMPDWRVV